MKSNSVGYETSLQVANGLCCIFSLERKETDNITVYYRGKNLDISSFKISSKSKKLTQKKFYKKMDQVVIIIKPLQSFTSLNSTKATNP